MITRTLEKPSQKSGRWTVFGFDKPCLEVCTKKKDIRSC